MKKNPDAIKEVLIRMECKLDDIKADLEELKELAKDHEKRIVENEKFRSTTAIVTTVLIPAVAAMGLGMLKVLIMLKIW